MNGVEWIVKEFTAVFNSLMVKGWEAKKDLGWEANEWLGSRGCAWHGWEAKRSHFRLKFFAEMGAMEPARF